MNESIFFFLKKSKLFWLLIIFSGSEVRPDHDTCYTSDFIVILVSVSYW